MVDTFDLFVKRYRSEKGSGVYTHTGLGNTKGCFYVSPDERPAFFAAYKAAMQRGENLHMMEVHSTGISPVLLDFDFRFDVEKDANGVDLEPVRQYTNDQVRELLILYFSELEKCVKCEGARAFVLEKPAPRIDRTRVKDGIHVVIPDVVTTPGLQYFVRERLLPLYASVLKDIGVVNSTDDCVDSAVIEKNPWTMLGSSKEGQPAYLVTKILSWKDGDLVEQPVPKDQSEFVEVLSIQAGKNVETEYVDEEIRSRSEAAYEAMLFKKREAEKNKRIRDCIMSDKPVKNNNVSKDDIYSLAQKIVKILKDERADDYESWMRTGWGLRNIDYRLLDEWIEFSKRSKKFEPGVCEREWTQMKVSPSGVGIGTLIMWAKEDNAQAYDEMVQNDIDYLMQKATNKTHWDVAMLAFRIFGHDYKCASKKNGGTWYRFDSSKHRWLAEEEGVSLKKLLSTEIVNRIVKKMHSLTAENADEDDTAVPEKTKKYSELSLKLKNNGFKKGVMDELADICYDASFESNLDTNLMLIGFQNGVYDLDSRTFRPGMPEDMISFSTNIDYEELDPSSREYADIKRVISEILPEEDVKEYVMTHMASMMDGNHYGETFHIWIGCGSNGKSVLINMMEKTFGDYSTTANVTLICGKRVASNQTNSELIRTRGRRVLTFKEPEMNEVLNLGLMKELSGADSIVARGLYSNPVVFRPQFKMLMISNHLPLITSTDNGTWRRIRVVEFISKFVRTPDPDRSKNEYPADLELDSKIEKWRGQFAAILLEEYYAKFVQNGKKIKEPEAVLKCTREYQEKSDKVGCFIAECLEKHAPEKRMSTTLNDVYEAYKYYLKEQYPTMTVPPRKDFQGLLRSQGLNFVMVADRAIYENVSLKNDEQKYDDM